MRALRYLGSLRGDDARAWLLGIVRNTCFTILERSRSGPQWVEFDEQSYAAESRATVASEPEAQWAQHRARVQIDAAIRALSPPLREAIVLREIEELDYAAIARITCVPIGTVMSRLSRARQALRLALAPLQVDD
jgi:RNA polymerase sigma-70 factor (ECF subfamily)